MSSPDYWRPKDPLTLPEFFCSSEAEAYGLFYGMAKLGGHQPFRAVSRHPDLPDHKIFEDIHSPIQMAKDPWGNEGDWRLLLRERRVVPPDPEDPRTPIEVRHEMVVAQRIGDEDFLVARYERPGLHARPVYGGREVALVDPLELLNKDLQAELNEQTSYMDWLSLAKVRTPAS
jgi:hypothetical protein